MKKILTYGLFLLIIVLGVAIYIYYPRLNLITGFAAKNVCSCSFIANRNLESIEETDNNFEPVFYAESEVFFDKKLATSEVFGLKERKAAYVKGIGCTLLPEGTSSENRNVQLPKRTKSTSNLPYPYGTAEPKDSVFFNVDYEQLQVAMDNAFEAENQTRAVLVLYKDHLLAEEYAPEFSPETPILGWSMTKSVTNAVMGVLEKQGKISLSQDHLFPEWENDRRSQITLNNLLHMNSGLEWEEDYTKISDVTKMLFLAEDMSRAQLQQPLVGEPGETWNYSSGTTNMLSGFIREQFDTHQQYLDFWYAELIDKIGMHSMVLETDLAGNYVGSSYSWATPRDWAKFGLLYLHKGNWNGEQILNESWVDYSTTPAAGSNGEYGAHFWLNAGGIYPNVPKDLFSTNGFQGQHIFIIPSEDLVVVRFGLVEHPDFDIDAFLSGIIDTLE